MTRKNKPDPVAGLAVKALAAEIVSLGLIFFFTKSIIYCIISLTGAAIGLAGFVLLVQSTDRLLKKGKGKTMFFLLAQAKLLIIAGIFYAITRITKIGVIFFIQGLAIVYLAIMIEGLVQMYGNPGNGT